MSFHVIFREERHGRTLDVRWIGAVPRVAEDVTITNGDNPVERIVGTVTHVTHVRKYAGEEPLIVIEIGDNT